MAHRLTLAGLLALYAAAAHSQPRAGLEEIVVTPSLVAQPRREIGTAVAVLDGGEIELRGYTGIADVLRTLPGVGVSNSGGPGKDTAVRIRGEEAFRTLLLIDGVKAIDPSAPQPAPSFDGLLATGDLERIEVLRGPQGFLYGADAGGVVNVMTKRGSGALTSNLDLEYGADDTRSVAVAFSGGSTQADYFVSITDFATDGFNAQTADTLLGDADGADNMTLHAKLGWNASERLRLQLVARDIDAATAHDGCFSPATFAVIHDCARTTEQTTTKLSADLGDERWSSSFGLSRIDIARANLAAGDPAFATVGAIDRFEYTGRLEASRAVAFVYGLDLQNEALESGPERLSRGQNGYYAEYQAAFERGLFFTLGARYDDNDDFGAHTSARVSAAYARELAAGSTIKYRASFGTGFRAPSLYEIAYNVGPFAFPPAAGFVLAEEQSRGYDWGVEFARTNGVRIEATYFDQDIEDEIYFDLTSFAGYLQSAGASRSRGIELGARAPLGERFELAANWTYNEATDGTNTERLRRPRHLGNLSLFYRNGNERLRLVASYRLARDALDIGGVTLDDYDVLDVSASYALSTKLELFGRIDNAANERYAEVQGYYTSSRSTYAGVRLRL